MLTSGINNKTILIITKNTPIVIKQNRKIAKPKINLKNPSELSIYFNY
jgi:hypothetical protein